MKIIKIIAAVLLCAAMLFSFTACMNKESAALVGTWEAEFDIAQYLNAAIDDEMDAYAQYFHVEELVMLLTVTYYDNGTYGMSVDADAFAKECESLVDEYTEGYEKAYQYISEETGVSVDVLLDEEGKTYEEMAEDFVATLDPGAMAEALSMTGEFKAEDGRLYRSNSADEKISKDSYETYELTEDGKLTVTGYVGEDADSNPFTYPMVFSKTK